MRGLVHNNQPIKTAMAEEHRPVRDREDDTSVSAATGRPIEADRKYFSIKGKTKQDMEKSEGVSCRLDWSGRGGEARIRTTARQHKQQTKQHTVAAHINRQWLQRNRGQTTGPAKPKVATLGSHDRSYSTAMATTKSWNQTAQPKSRATRQVT